MFEQMTDALDFHGRALQLRASRQETIASNIANADTPNFKAKDFDFGAALREASGMPASDAGSRATLPAAEGGLNTVDLNRERAQFSQNAVGYEASLRFLNGRIKTMMTAIRGE